MAFGQGEKVSITTKSILEMITEQWHNSGGKTAVQEGHRRVSYTALLAISSKISSLILESRNSSDFVIILLPAGYKFIAAEIATWSANRTPIPVDASLPKSRIHTIIQNHVDPLVITDPCISQRLNLAGTCKALIILPEGFEFTAEAIRVKQDIKRRINPISLCIYTSGSTGTPKGVLMRDDSLVNFVHWNLRHYGEAVLKRSLFFSSPGFDMAFTQTIPPLCAGGTVVILPGELRRDIEALEEFVRLNEITFLCLPAIVGVRFLTRWNLTGGEGRSALKILMFAGERVAQVDGMQLSEKLGFCVENHYGLTEGTIGQTFIQYRPGDVMSLSVGRPIQNMKVCVVRENGVECDVLEEGDVFIGGIGVCEYYDGASERWRGMLRTHDRGFWRGDGTLEVCGREGDIVKISGEFLQKFRLCQLITN